MKNGIKLKVEATSLVSEREEPKEHWREKGGKTKKDGERDLTLEVRGGSTYEYCR